MLALSISCQVAEAEIAVDHQLHEQAQHQHKLSLLGGGNMLDNEDFIWRFI